MRKIVAVLLLLIATGCASKMENRFVFQEKTAVDQKTGRVWTKNANLPGKPLVWKGDDNVYGFIQKLNRENFAGYADWRTPSREEMEDLIAYARSLGYDREKMETWPFQTLRTLGFEDVRDYPYWTGTRHSKEALWVADLARGEVVPKPDSDHPYSLWPVRGGKSK